MHLFWKRIALFNMFIRNIHVSLCSINLCLENGPRKKCIWKRICQIHQIRWIKYKYKYKYMVWNLIKYKYKYKYAVFVFVFVFANTNTSLTPALTSDDNVGIMTTVGFQCLPTFFIITLLQYRSEQSNISFVVELQVKKNHNYNGPQHH